MQHAVAVPVVEKLICSNLLLAQTGDVYQYEHRQECAHDDKSPTQRHPLPQSITHRPAWDSAKMVLSIRE